LLKWYKKKKGNFKQVNLHPSFIDRLIRLVKHEKNPYLVKKTLMRHFLRYLFGKIYRKDVRAFSFLPVAPEATGREGELSTQTFPRREQYSSQAARRRWSAEARRKAATRS
jgi:hypothetical protein